MSSLVFRVKENSMIARFAAFKLRTANVAIVVGSTVHLWNCTREDFLSNRKWLRHELCHVQQFRRYGFMPFIFLYLWESLKKGYRNNKFEKEARDSEDSPMPDVRII